MKTPLCALPGALSKANRGAVDWGWGSNLLAYGCQSTVVVLDPETVQVIQVLERYKSPVVAVKWARENYHHDLSNPYALTLAAADAQGRILIWDVVQASVKAEFSEPVASSVASTPPVTDLHWLASVQDASHDLLVALHAPSTVILWNADSGAKIWKKTYSDPLTRFAFDPFDGARVTFLAADGLLCVEDFGIGRCPPTNGDKLYVAAATAGSAAGGSMDRRRKETSLRSKMRMLVSGDSESGRMLEDFVVPNECLQLTYHRAVRRHLLMVYPKEILVMDLGINQTVGAINLERGGASFVRVISCRQSDAVFCLHDNGVVSLRRRVAATKSADGDEEMNYETLCFSDPLRLTRHLDVFGFACSPVSEDRLSLLLSDGRTMFWHLTSGPNDAEDDSRDSSAHRPPVMTLRQRLLQPGRTQLLLAGLNPALSSPIGPGVPSGGGAAAGVCVLKMCPPLTTKNIESYQPLLAVGTRTGAVQIYNLSTGIQAFEFSLHTAAVKGVEWVTLRSFLSFCVIIPPSYSSSSSPSPVKNELSLVDVNTGRVTSVKAAEEAALEAVRVSHMRQYFILVYKGRPFELWDMKTLTLLRQMPKSCPTVAALEWSPSHSVKSVKKKSGAGDAAPVDAAGSEAPVEAGGSAPGLWPITAEGFEGGETGSDAKSSQRSVANGTNAGAATAKEHFVFVDTDGLLYHFVVEGHVIKDGSKISPDGGLGSITAIAWKSETMVLGDVDGNLNVWDLKGRVSRSVPTHRGLIKKLKFAPGRGNMKLVVVFGDGAEIWDSKEVRLCASLKTPRDGAKTLDADWASSDKPILASMDGVLRVVDLGMRKCCSPFEDSKLGVQIFAPHLMPPRLSIFLKSFLENQVWSSSGFDLNLMRLSNSSLPLDVVAESSVIKSLQQRVDAMPPDVTDYLPSCRFGTAERCLIVARLFGDESAMHLWQVALFFLRRKSAREGKRFVVGGVVDLASLDDPFRADSAAPSPEPLPLSADVLMSNAAYKTQQLDRLSLQDSRSSTYEQISQCIENYIYLGLTDRAVQLLLETEPTNPNHYVDALRACLAATARADGDSQSTIKLVATSMIAAGKVSQGCQLLCLIDKALDACRYLQTYGQWHQAIWLAKSRLSEADGAEVMKRYVDYLCSANVNLKSYAILVLISLEQFTRAVELMLGMRQYDRAACFVESLVEFGIWETPTESSTTQTSRLSRAAFREFARLLLGVGNVSAARHYARKASGGELADSAAALMTDIDAVEAAFVESRKEKGD